MILGLLVHWAMRWNLVTKLSGGLGVACDALKDNSNAKGAAWRQGVLGFATPIMKKVFVVWFLHQNYGRKSSYAGNSRRIIVIAAI